MATADASKATSATSKKQQYLLTDNGFGTKLALNLMAISLVSGLCYHIQPLYEIGFEAYGWLNEQMMVAAHRMAWWSLLGLLSSSCCALQIMLNAFSFGCAGFNTTLGPLRPTFVALTVTVQALAWVVAYPRPWQWAPTAAATTLATVLTLMPEALALHTAWREWCQQQDIDRQAATTTALHFRLSTLGCAACVSKVSSVLNAMPAVASHKVSLEDGLATVHLTNDEGAHQLGKTRAEQQEAVVTRLTAAGFPATALHACVCESNDSGQTNDGCCSKDGAAAKDDGATSVAEWVRNNSVGSAIAAGLLSSSCCILQVALNLLSVLNVAHVGCAGFNKVLGPWRPQLRCCTIAWLSTMWFLSIRKGWSKFPLLCSTALALSLAWLPEILLVLGEGSVGADLASARDWLGLPGISGVAPSYDGAELLRLHVNGMGCEACQLHVRTTLEMASGVIWSRVDWGAGTAEVLFNRAWGFNLTDVSNRLAVDGYDVAVAPTTMDGR